jgi:hypothetical protein
MLLLNGALGLPAQTSFGDLRNLIDRSSKTPTDWVAPRSLKDWTKRRLHLQTQILASAGLYPLPERTPLRPQRFGRMLRSSYTVERVVLETLPGFQLVGNLYFPAKPIAGKIPAVLVAHGHWKHGRVHHADDYSVPALCVNLAAQGFAVFAWDMIGYNDTKQLPHDFGKTQEEQLHSFGPLGIQLWNAIRAIDFVESLDKVDPTRIGMTGASGGGTQTYLAAAVDPRIRAAAPVNMVSSTFQGDDDCEIAPTLRLGIGNVEIASMIAPRPLLLISSTKDWTRNTPLVEFPLVQQVYSLYGRPRNVRHTQIDAPHNYNQASREAAYAFFNRTLNRLRIAPKESEPMDLGANDLLAEDWEGLYRTRDKKLVFSTWRTLTAAAASSLTNDAWREALEAASGIRWPVRVTAIAAGKHTLLTRDCCGDRIPLQSVPGASPTIVRVDGDGISSAKKQLLKNQAYLLIDPFQTGSAEAARVPFGSDYLTFHMSDDANRVQDLITTISYLAIAEKRKSVTLDCSGGAVSWCLVAAALSHLPVELLTDGSTPKPVFIPGFERLGGMSAVERRRLPDPRPATLDLPSLLQE